MKLSHALLMVALAAGCWTSESGRTKQQKSISQCQKANRKFQACLTNNFKDSRTNNFKYGAPRSAQRIAYCRSKHDKFFSKCAQPVICRGFCVNGPDADAVKACELAIQELCELAALPQQTLDPIGLARVNPRKLTAAGCCDWRSGDLYDGLATNYGIVEVSACVDGFNGNIPVDIVDLCNGPNAPRGCEFLACFGGTFLPESGTCDVGKTWNSNPILADVGCPAEAPCTGCYDEFGLCRAGIDTPNYCGITGGACDQCTGVCTNGLCCTPNLGSCAASSECCNNQANGCNPGVWLWFSKVYTASTTVSFNSYSPATYIYPDGSDICCINDGQTGCGSPMDCCSYDLSSYNPKDQQVVCSMPTNTPGSGTCLDTSGGAKIPTGNYGCQRDADCVSGFCSVGGGTGTGSSPVDAGGNAYNEMTLGQCLASRSCTPLCGAWVSGSPSCCYGLPNPSGGNTICNPKDSTNPSLKVPDTCVWYI